ncbi:FtsX-like permease family protein [Candidatus Nomurabacteria bacterium]|nr:FtsX-like permease family protein [Candidatus Nomurabacteria bacterium]
MINIIRSTIKNIIRNKWLALATIMVSFIVFATASFFISMSFVAQRAVKVAETKAEVRIFFQLDTPEDAITELRTKIEDIDGVAEINYINKEEALKLYTEYIGYYDADSSLIDSTYADWFPASLEIKASSLDDLSKITNFIKNEQELNPYIEDVQFREDIVDQLKSISLTIGIGAIITISIFVSITVALIAITIAFNIRSHTSEIEIMHLVGSTDKHIKAPFILEGTLYTVLGSLLAAGLILGAWSYFLHNPASNDLSFITDLILKELSLTFLEKMSTTFLLEFFGLHLVAGLLLGMVSSYVTVFAQLNLKET